MQCFFQQEADLFVNHSTNTGRGPCVACFTKHSNSTVFPRPLSGQRCIMAAVRDQIVVTLGETRCHADALTGQMPKLMDARPSVIRSSELNHYASLSRAGRSKTKTIDTGDEKWRTLSATSGQRRVVKVNRK